MFVQFANTKANLGTLTGSRTLSIDFAKIGYHSMHTASILTFLDKLFVGEALQLHCNRQTLLMSVHTTVLTSHSLMLQSPQEVVAYLTPRWTLIRMHL